MSLSPKIESSCQTSTARSEGTAAKPYSGAFSVNPQLIQREIQNLGKSIRLPKGVGMAVMITAAAYTYSNLQRGLEKLEKERERNLHEVYPIELSSASQAGKSTMTGRLVEEFVKPRSEISPSQRWMNRRLYLGEERFNLSQHSFPTLDSFTEAKSFFREPIQHLRRVDPLIKENSADIIQASLESLGRIFSDEKAQPPAFKGSLANFMTKARANNLFIGSLFTKTLYGSLAMEERSFVGRNTSGLFQESNHESSATNPSERGLFARLSSEDLIDKGKVLTGLLSGGYAVTKVGKGVWGFCFRKQLEVMKDEKPSVNWFSKIDKKTCIIAGGLGILGVGAFQLSKIKIETDANKYIADQALKIAEERTKQATLELASEKERTRQAQINTNALIRMEELRQGMFRSQTPFQEEGTI